jgi:hypothetical protein
VINPGLPKSLWAELDGRLWHATDHNGLTGILADERIRVSTANRYENSLCCCLGCVSLFDFGRDASDQDDLEFSNWAAWLGSEHTGRCAIWLEIQREQSADRLFGPTALLEIRRREQLNQLFFIGVEACHKGPIATSAIAGALILDRDDRSSFRRYDGEVAGLMQAVATFLQSLPPPPVDRWAVLDPHRRRRQVKS